MKIGPTAWLLFLVFRRIQLCRAHEKLASCDLQELAKKHCRLLRKFGKRVIRLEDCGGVRESSDLASAQRNGKALAAAFGAAQPGDEILIPYGSRYFMIPHCELWWLADEITLSIAGSLSALDEIEAWPANGTKYISLLSVRHAKNLKVKGGGTIEGNGHKWWWQFFLPPGLKSKRPMLIDFYYVQNLIIEDIALFNSPRFHIHVMEAQYARISNIVILVDWKHQQHITRTARSSSDWQEASWFGAKARAWLQTAIFTNPSPMFPFNTDGVDVAGSNILVENLLIENWDDVVAIKPSKRPITVLPFYNTYNRSTENSSLAPTLDLPNTSPTNFEQSTDSKSQSIMHVESYLHWNWCTRDVIVRNITSLFGAGLSVGDVVSGKHHECVRGATFEDITMHRPYKGVYVKASGGCGSSSTEDCSALVADVHYRDIRIHGSTTPHWWNQFVRRQRHRGGVLPLTKRNQVHDSSGWPLSINFLRISTKGAPVQAPTWSCRTHWWLGRLPCFAWPLYIGPQQQTEPYSTNSPGLWPSSRTGVAIMNLTVTRFKVTGGDWPEAAAAIRCDPERPCTGLLFQDIHINAHNFGHRRTWVCDYERVAFGDALNVLPHPGACLHHLDDSTLPLDQQHYTISHTGPTSAARRRGRNIEILFISLCILLLLLFCACCCVSSTVFYVAYKGKAHSAECNSARLCLSDDILRTIFAARARCARYYNGATEVVACASTSFFIILRQKARSLCTYTCGYCFSKERAPLISMNRPSASGTIIRLGRHRYKILPEKDTSDLSYATNASFSPNRSHSSISVAAGRESEDLLSAEDSGTNEQDVALSPC